MQSALWAILAASMGMSILCDQVFPSLSCIFAAALGALGNLFHPYDTFEPDAFFFIIVPPVVLQSGLCYKWVRKRSEMTLFMAWVGTSITTAWTTLGLLPYIPWPACAALAAVCSPTDTVSTTVLTRHADESLRKTLQHESLLNDAVGFLFTHLFARADGLEASAIAVLVLSIIGSATVGVFTARVHTLYTNHGAVSTLVAVLFLYSAVEWAQGSGILALFLFGVCVRRWRTHDMHDLMITLEVIVDVLEKYVYVTMGSILHTIEPGHVGMAAIILASIYASRAFHIGIGALITRAVSLEESIFLVGCNVRGAFTIALASISSVPYFQSIAILIVIWTHALALITVGPIGNILDII